MLMKKPQTVIRVIKTTQCEPTAAWVWAAVLAKHRHTSLRIECDSPLQQDSYKSFAPQPIDSDWCVRGGTDTVILVVSSCTFSLFFLFIILFISKKRDYWAAAPTFSVLINDGGFRWLIVSQRTSKSKDIFELLEEFNDRVNYLCSVFGMSHKTGLIYYEAILALHFSQRSNSFFLTYHQTDDEKRCDYVFLFPNES